MFRNERADIKSETLRLSDYTNVIIEENIKFSSKIPEQENNISVLTTYIEELLEKRSVKHIVGINIEASRSELDATIEIVLDEIKADYDKNHQLI